MRHELVISFPGAMFVSDINGIILETENKAVEICDEAGGEKLTGKNLFDCHPRSARLQFEEIKNRTIIQCKMAHFIRP